jgi:L,D-peptidoglycan transpeptidase YkuD (ErfK/YbiS/YcfS/YnhG family)
MSITACGAASTPPPAAFFASATGRIAWPTGSARCAIGRGGAIEAADKREGDGATPLGCWPFRRVFFRADRLAAPATRLSAIAIQPDMGWCDDPGSPHYNCLVALPFLASHERMWREDSLYDVVVELGYNDDPAVPGLGSAIFLHVATPDFGPTEGCVATDRDSLLALLAAAAPGDWLCVTR